MYLIKGESLNQVFIKACKLLQENGVEQERRGFKCKELPGAVLVQITNPTDRYINIPERKWNKVLGWIESLWIARGDNSLTMPLTYVDNLKNFSDDGLYMRAGYGPRIRRYGQHSYRMITPDGYVLENQYKIAHASGHLQYLRKTRSQDRTDQLHFIIEKFKEDPTTREAVITIHDPVADNFNTVTSKLPEGGTTQVIELLKTKDTPCTRSIHFMTVNGKLNCYVDIRSNDLIWGFSAVNIFNFTLMQEYVAGILGLPIGDYYHKIDNLHVYDRHYKLIKDISEKYDADDFPSIKFQYETTFKSLDDFDNLITDLSFYEHTTWDMDKLKRDPLFSDWAQAIYYYWSNDPNKKINFINPLLERLYYES